MFGSFLPRRHARLVTSEGEAAAVQKVRDLGYISKDSQYMEGTKEHYNFFESLIS